MAWLQSSFTNHQLLSESSTKGSGLSRHQSSDKSHMPLLSDSSGKSVEEDDDKDWLRNASSLAGHKTDASRCSSKPNFLSRSLFDKGSKDKSVVSSSASMSAKRSSENRHLLTKESYQKNVLSNEESDDAESDDEFSVLHTGQYQRVKSVADY